MADSIRIQGLNLGGSRARMIKCSEKDNDFLFSLQHVLLGRGLLLLQEPGWGLPGRQRRAGLPGRHQARVQRLRNKKGCQIIESYCLIWKERRRAKDQKWKRSVLRSTTLMGIMCAFFFWKRVTTNLSKSTLLLCIEREGKNNKAQMRERIKCRQSALDVNPLQKEMITIR